MPTYTFRAKIGDGWLNDELNQVSEGADTYTTPEYNERFVRVDDVWYSEETEVCTISEMEEKERKGYVVVPAAPFIGDTFRQGLKKPSEGFRDVLRTIKKKHRGGKRVDATRGINTF